MLFKKNCADLKLVLIKYKKDELKSYRNLPHLAMPILTEPKRAVAGLKWITNEMDRRKNIFKKLGIPCILKYNKKFILEKLPYIVIIADEYAD